MNLVLAVVAAAVVLVGAGAARADGPAGFRENVRLEPAASFVAGKKVRVWCATSRAAFAAAAETMVSGAGADTTGFASVGGADEYLVPLGCATLTAWLNGKRPDDYTLAASALLLAHEATHLRGVADEGATDCAALAKLATMLRRYFPTKGRASIHDLISYAVDNHERKPLAYQGSC